MLALKLRPKGKKHQRTYRVVVMEKRSKLRGKFIDDVGWYNPHNKKAELKKEAIIDWLKKGVQPTDSVHNLLVREKIIHAPKRPKHKIAKKQKEEPKPEENASQRQESGVENKTNQEPESGGNKPNA